MTRLYESEIEQITLDLLRDENGYEARFGPDLAEGADVKFSAGRFGLEATHS